MAITWQEALDCFQSDDLVGIGMEADAVRRTLHPENVVTYAVPSILAIDQPPSELLATAENCARDSDTTVRLTQAHGLSLPRIEESLRAIRQRSPALRIEALSTGEIATLAEALGLDLSQVVSRLRAAGLDAISGDDLCAVSPDLYPGTDIVGLLALEPWLQVHRVAHRDGITSTAGLLFGLGESSEDRVRHLFALRALQAETAGFTAFSLLVPQGTARLEAPTAVEFLRTLAIARIVLDNIPSMACGCLAHGLKVTQMALRFGADDAGLMTNSGASPKAAFTEEDLRRVIRDAGFMPVERDLLYRTLFLNN